MLTRHFNIYDPTVIPKKQDVLAPCYLYGVAICPMPTAMLKGSQNTTKSPGYFKKYILNK